MADRKSKPNLEKYKRPAWYTRVCGVVLARAREECTDPLEPHSSDFDEDISEKEGSTCDNDSSGEYSCYSGSDAENYSNFELLRDYRKEELRHRREQQEDEFNYHKGVEEQMARELTKLNSDEMRGARAKNPKLESGVFRVYSSDYIRSQNLRAFAGVFRSPYIEFSSIPYYDSDSDSDSDIDLTSDDRSTSKQMCGHIWCNSDDKTLEVFESPKIPTKSITVETKPSRQNSKKSVNKSNIDFYFNPVSTQHKPTAQPSTKIGVYGCEGEMTLTVITEDILKISVPISVSLPGACERNTLEAMELSCLREAYDWERIEKEFEEQQNMEKQEKQEQKEAGKM